MKTRSLLFAGIVASALLLLSAPAGATTPLFTETFDGNDVAWSYASGGTPSTDNAGWSWSSSTYKARHAVRLGKSNGGVGSTTTPSILIPSGWSKASVTVTFQAAAWFGATSGLTLSKIENGVTTEIDSWSVSQIADTQANANNNVADLSAFTSDTNGKPYTATFEVRDSFELVFATTGSGANCRSFLDSVTVTAEEVVSSLTTLDTPTGLASSDIGFFGFSLSWNSVLNATNGYTVTLSPAEGNVSVNGTIATVTGLSEGGTYTASVVANGDSTGTEDSVAATLDVTTATAPAVSVPVLTASGVSSSAFTVSWPAQNDASFSVRAWNLVPADVATEDFAGYKSDGTIPEGWTFENSHEHYTYEEAPVDFKGNTTLWIGTPAFGGTVASVSFHLRRVSAVTGTFTVYGSTGSTDPSDWVEIKTWTNTEIVTGDYDVDELANGDSLDSAGFKRLFFRTTKTAGNFGFGSFSVTGTGVGKARSYLTGYGSDAAGVAVGGTSVTVSNPVVGETNYVEVTATGLTGRTASSVLPVPVPRPSTVISVW